MSWGHLPGPARAVAVATTDAVASTGDPEGFTRATARLAALDPRQVALVLGAVVRALLEELHPDGLGADDVRAVLARVPDVDPDLLLGVLAGALGVHPPDEQRAPVPPVAVARHATLLIADLRTRTGRPLAGYLTAAFNEIARAEAMDC